MSRGRCWACGKDPCETGVYCRAVGFMGSSVKQGPEGQPIISRERAAVFVAEFEAFGGTLIADDANQCFVGLNFGVADDGQAVNIQIVAQVEGGAP